MIYLFIIVSLLLITKGSTGLLLCSRLDSITADIIGVRVKWHKGRGNYRPVMRYYYDDHLYTNQVPDYYTIIPITVGTHRKVFINKNNPSKPLLPTKYWYNLSTGIIIFIVTLLFI